MGLTGSPDSTSLVFLVWGIAKNYFFSVPILSRPYVKETIEQATAAVNTETLINVWNTIGSRTNHITSVIGGHIEQNSI